MTMTMLLHVHMEEVPVFFLRAKEDLQPPPPLPPSPTHPPPFSSFSFYPCLDLRPARMSPKK